MDFRKFTELTEKYRDLLDKSNTLVAHKEVTSGYEGEVKRLEHSNGELTAQLEIEKEKLHTLEAAFENMRKQGLRDDCIALFAVFSAAHKSRIRIAVSVRVVLSGMMKTSDLSSSDVLSMSKRVTTLEMKELNERQRADHAVSSRQRRGCGNRPQ